MDWGNDITALFTKNKCTDSELLEHGYTYQVFSSIPLQLLKKHSDSWFIVDNHAATVKGCWFKKDNEFVHIKMRRKKDNKIFEYDVNINDGTRIVANNVSNNLLNVSNDPSSTPTKIEQSSKETSFQDEFEISRTGKLSAYNSAANEIQKSAIFNQANEDTAYNVSKIGGLINRWSGKINSITTSHAGKEALVTILSDNNVEYTSDSEILIDSPIYKKLSTIKEGQHVIFSGKIVPNFNGFERSITEHGSLRKPEFNVEFTSIESSVR